MVRQTPNCVVYSTNFKFSGLLASLDRLQLEYVDILLVTSDPDRRASIEEIVRACSFVVNQGWAFYWGTSNWSTEDLMVCINLCGTDILQLLCPLLIGFTSSILKQTFLVAFKLSRNTLFIIGNYRFKER